MSTEASSFATRLVAWQRQHGRHDLPWQGSADPYRVWLSEIMLQQTQVATVKEYFVRFLQRFPDVGSLARASEDEVLGLWSGLGYYSRARNLHRCAQIVMEQHAGVFPRSSAALAELPGIGRSTAAAIASLCFAERVAILDANVRRVVSRVQAFAGDLAQSSSERILWQLATDLLPAESRAQADMAAYTQGMMDLGASLCSPRQPACTQCPVAEFCKGFAQGTATQFPVRSRTLKRQSVSLWLLLARQPDGSIWLVKRPQRGIWAGLHCLPVFDSEPELRGALAQKWAGSLQAMPVLRHALTHRELFLHPLQVQINGAEAVSADGYWVGAAQWPGLGLPAPVRKLLEPL